MGLLLTLIFAMTVWIIVWATGHSGFDGFLLALLIMMIAAGVRVMSPYLPGKQPDRD